MDLSRLPPSIPSMSSLNSENMDDSIIEIGSSTKEISNSTKYPIPKSLDLNGIQHGKKGGIARAYQSLAKRCNMDDPVTKHNVEAIIKACTDSLSEDPSSRPVIPPGCEQLNLNITEKENFNLTYAANDQLLSSIIDMIVKEREIDAVANENDEIKKPFHFLDESIKTADSVNTAALKSINGSLTMSIGKNDTVEVSMDMSTIKAIYDEITGDQTIKGFKSMQKIARKVVRVSSGTFHFVDQKNKTIKRSDKKDYEDFLDQNDQLQSNLANNIEDFLFRKNSKTSKNNQLSEEELIIHQQNSNDDEYEYHQYHSHNSSDNLSSTTSYSNSRLTAYQPTSTNDDEEEEIMLEMINSQVTTNTNIPLDNIDIDNDEEEDDDKIIDDMNDDDMIISSNYDDMNINQKEEKSKKSNKKKDIKNENEQENASDIKLKPLKPRAKQTEISSNKKFQQYLEQYRTRESTNSEPAAPKTKFDPSDHAKEAKKKHEEIFKLTDNNNNISLDS